MNFRVYIYIYICFDAFSYANVIFWRVFNFKLIFCIKCYSELMIFLLKIQLKIFWVFCAVISSSLLSIMLQPIYHYDEWENLIISYFAIITMKLMHLSKFRNELLWFNLMALIKNIHFCYTWQYTSRSWAIYLEIFSKCTSHLRNEIEYHYIKELGI